MITPPTTPLAPVPLREASGRADPADTRADGFAVLFAALAAAPPVHVRALVSPEPSAGDVSRDALAPPPPRSAVADASAEPPALLAPRSPGSDPGASDASLFAAPTSDQVLPRATGVPRALASAQRPDGTTADVAGVPSPAPETLASVSAAFAQSVALPATTDPAPAMHALDPVVIAAGEDVMSARARHGDVAPAASERDAVRAPPSAVAPDGAGPDMANELQARALESLARGAEARIPSPTPDRASAAGGSPVERAPASVSRAPDTSASRAPSVPPAGEEAAPPSIAEGDGAKPPSPAEATVASMAGSEEFASVEPHSPSFTRPAPAAATSTPTTSSHPPPSVQIAQAVFAADGVSLERLRLRLHPVELGAVEVVVESERVGRARAILLVERPETLELLRRDLPALERLFAQAGLALAPGGLELGLQAESGGSESGRTPASLIAETAEAPPPSPIAAPAVPTSLSLVDLTV